MISPRLLELARCPECAAALDSQASSLRCPSCGRVFDAGGGYLDLRPATSFAEQTKYLDHDLHADARHASIAPPVLGSRIRNHMLRRFLAPGQGDRIVDLGCGSGRALAWHVSSGAQIVGLDISPYFAREAIASADLVLGDLRRLPLASGSFNKAWSLDVLEHLSPAALEDTLREVNRVLEPGGAFFIYTHVRKNGWPAAGVRLVNRLARRLEGWGWLDLGQERLRKSDHLNPLRDHDELRQAAHDSGFDLERVTYYSPVVGAFVENVLARVVERALVARPGAGAARSRTGADTIRAVRADAQARVRRGGWTYRALVGVTWIMHLDLWLFGRVPSGPFFALLRKVRDVGPARVSRAARRIEEEMAPPKAV